MIDLGVYAVGNVGNVDHGVGDGVEGVGVTYVTFDADVGLGTRTQRA